MEWKWYFSEFLILKCNHLFCWCTFSLCILCICPYPYPSVYLGGPEHMIHVQNSPTPVGCNVFALPVVKDEPASVSAHCLWESSKSWGVERSQTKPTVPNAPSPSPSSLSNAQHTPPKHSSSFLGIISPRLLSYCVLFVDSGLSVNSFVCICVCINTKMTTGGYCMTGGNTMERVC